MLPETLVYALAIEVVVDMISDRICVTEEDCGDNSEGEYASSTGAVASGTSPDISMGGSIAALTSEFEDVSQELITCVAQSKLVRCVDETFALQSTYASCVSGRTRRSSPNVEEIPMPTALVASSSSQASTDDVNEVSL
eukprot:TRINITY_DN48803_c0_g1_i1.p1 TRINITY_DN48803_c0_g1~~TRINITY_DN48803_c0_g1_i1.p1  ORF type:complete len:159 (-),score=14.34 TRINITY_DN48803_c0_g1_i1:391-807(-)